MFAKLAARNVKRQMSNYLIYFVTVTLTVSMMFALCNLIFSDQLRDYAAQMAKLQSALIAVAIVISLIVAFVLGYASSFMLKLRKREFGTYLTLGMTRKNILVMFTAENLLIAIAALVCGILFGLVVFQGTIGLIARVLDMKLSLGSYSLNGLLMTVGLTLGTFLLSTLSSALYLRKVSIYDLLHADTKVTGKVKHPALWIAITIISLVTVIFSIFKTYDAIKTMFEPQDTIGDGGAATQMFAFIALLSVGVIFYHIGFSKSALHFLLKNQTLKCKGTNTFVLRQLSEKLSSNAVLCGMIAFLITATVLCTNVCFAQKASVDSYLNQNFPFDISLNLSTLKNNAPYTYEDALAKIKEQSPIKNSIPYNIYTSGNGYLHSFTPWTGEKYEGLYDTFILESDFNRLSDALGYESISLSDRFLILSEKRFLSSGDFSDALLTLGDNTYSLWEVTDRYPSFANTNMLVVVPDSVKSALTVDTEKIVFELEKDDIDAQALKDSLTYTVSSSQGYPVTRCPASIRDYYELEENSLTAILIVGELYMAIIFVFLATAILTMKLLAETSEDFRRYDLLYKLGSGLRERKTALFLQTFTMFAFPFFLPLLLSIPVGFICGKIIAFGGYGNLVTQMYQNAAIIAVILIFIQLLYFGATYITKKNHVIH